MKTATERRAMYEEAYERASTCASARNMAVVLHECEARGYPDPQPGFNVLTFAAWRALGRHVRKGEKGISVLTFVPMSKTAEKDGEEVVKTWSSPRAAYVFHVCQTDADEPKAA